MNAQPLSIASALLPVGLIALLIYAKARGVRVLSAFLSGAEDAFGLLKTLLPCLAALLAAIRTLRDSGVFSMLEAALAPALRAVGVDARLVPILLMRPLSGSAAVAALTELFTAYGPDSPVGLTASVLLGSSETLLYSLALYFGAVGVRKTRFAVPLAAFAALVSLIAGLFFSRLFFGA